MHNLFFLKIVQASHANSIYKFMNTKIKLHNGMNIRLNIVVVTEIKNSLVNVTHNRMHSMKNNRRNMETVVMTSQCEISGSYGCDSVYRRHLECVW
jgi:hypothetical protein